MWKNLWTGKYYQHISTFINVNSTTGVGKPSSGDGKGCKCALLGVNEQIIPKEQKLRQRVEIGMIAAKLRLRHNDGILQAMAMPEQQLLKVRSEK